MKFRLIYTVLICSYKHKETFFSYNHLFYTEKLWIRQFITIWMARETSAGGGKRSETTNMSMSWLDTPFSQ